MTIGEAQKKYPLLVPLASVGMWMESFLNLPTFSKILARRAVSFSAFSLGTTGIPSTQRMVSRPFLIHIFFESEEREGR